MSKIETVKRLNDSAPQLQIISQISSLQATLSEIPQQLSQQLEQIEALNQSTAAMPQQLQQQITEQTSAVIGALNQQIEQIPQQLSSLPPYLANELSQRLEPLTSLPAQVKQALTSFDQVTAAQRQTLDELTQHQRQQLSQRLTEIDKAISQLQAQVQPIAQLPAALIQQTRLLREAREELVEELETSSQRLSSWALKVRPAWWKRAAAAAAAGAIGAVIAVTGQAALSGLVPPSAVQQDAKWAAAVWSKATEQERQLLNRIVQRQGQ